MLRVENVPPTLPWKDRLSQSHVAEARDPNCGRHYGTSVNATGLRRMRSSSAPIVVYLEKAEIRARGAGTDLCARSMVR